MAPAECRNTFQENVTESIHYALELKDILDHERSALEQKDTTALNEAAISKQVCVNKLDDLDKDRGRIATECGFPGNGESTPELIEWCDDQHEIAASWSRFLDIAETCSNLNAGNGAVIRVRQAQVNNALGILRDGTTDVNTYGPTGQNGGELKTRSLAEA
jgi:flagella synthesis protein FlgN